MFGGLGYLNKLGASGGLVFSPRQLFSGGEQGAWYDPSDNTTMFQDSAGTTPVTAVEQAVGLMLDKSKGLVLGPELMTNGGPVFVNTTGWSGVSSATVSVVGGNLRVTRGATAGVQTATIQYTGAVVGQWYAMTVSMSANSANINTTIQSYGNSVLANSATVSGTPTRTIYYMADRTNPFLIFRLETGAQNDYVDISLASVKALPGNHAFQSTSASRPTLRARYNLLRYSEEIANGVGDWFVNNATVTANNAASPIGTMTASRIVADGTNINQGIYNNQTAVPAGVTAIFSVWLRGQVGGEEVVIGDASSRQTVILTTSWQRFTNPSHALLSNNQVIYAKNNTAATFYAWGAQLVPTAVFPSNVYQRIAAATDYATGPEFPQYLAFDGTDDSLLTANVDFATVTSDGQARRNLLLNPTQFDAAGWTAVTATVTANSTVAPDGTTTADTVVSSASGGRVQQNVTVSATSQYVLSCYLRPGTVNTAALRIFNNTTATNLAEVTFNVLTGVVTTTTVGSGTITSVGGGWYRCEVTHTGTVTSGDSIRAYVYPNGTSSTASDSTIGWGAQLETGSTATAFQNIGTDKMTVFSGLSKLSDAATAFFVELSATSTTNNGTFAVFAPNTAADYGWRARGTISVTLVPSGYASPRTNVITGIGNLAAPLTQIRINGVIATTDSSTSPGTGNYLSYPLYIGRRNNASFPFNGRLYSLIVRGAASNSTQIEQTERYVASKTPLGVVP